VRLYSLAETSRRCSARNGGAIDAWSAALSSGGRPGTLAVLQPTALTGGTVLEVRGNATGSSGGFSGVINLTASAAVPGRPAAAAVGPVAAQQAPQRGF
jgi:hypothetical protein